MPILIKPPDSKKSGGFGVSVLVINIIMFVFWFLLYVLNTG